VHLLILTDTPENGKTLLGALEFLDHTIACAPLNADPGGAAREADVVLVDATRNLGGASHACRVVAAADLDVPVLVVIGDGGLAALKASWGFDDWLLPSAQPAEAETRLRLLPSSGPAPPSAAAPRASATCPSTRTPTSSGCAGSRSTSPTGSSSC
jgi:hypothetical protein